MISYENYEKKRFVWDKDRIIVWGEITKYLQKYIKKNSSILDLGSGYCDFINSISARKKYALDNYFNPKEYASREVTSILGDFSLMKKRFKNNSLDIVFASNFFEHLTEKKLERCINLIKKKLKETGILIVIQPNYRLCRKHYFEDYTHMKAWTEISFTRYLRNKGFSIKECIPGFIPFSMKSKLPKNKFLIRIYLRSPIKPFAAQMLIIARK
jgi:ubiquinone/menaquinone biosynthesis C-methylase UbiE